MFILYFIIAINIIGFLIMGYDKGLAKLNSRRIPEKILFIIAFLGGAMGAYLGMKIFHHKTKHPRFVYGIPILVLIHLVLFVLIYRYLIPIIID